jgi:hypothetical protein
MDSAFTLVLQPVIQEISQIAMLEQVVHLSTWWMDTAWLLLVIQSILN